MARKAGKYAALVGKLPKFKNHLDDPNRRDLIDEVRRTIVQPPMHDDLKGSVEEILERMDEDFKELLAIQRRATAGKPWASEFARVYAELRDIKNKLSGWESSLNVVLDAYTELMVDQFEVEGIASIRLENNQLVTTWPEPHAQVEDREKFRQWCIKQGLEKQLQLAWQTTNAMTKELLLQGQPEPEGVTAYMETKIQLRGE